MENKVMYKGFTLSFLVIFFVSVVQAQESIEELTRLAEQGDLEAQIELSNRYSYGRGTEENEERALHWLKKAADQGHANAQYMVGMMYERGTGVEKNLEEAIRWYKRAAKQGHVVAQYMVGMMYERGTGVEKNLGEAIRWYKEAAKRHVGAQKRLQELASEGNCSDSFGST